MTYDLTLAIHEVTEARKVYDIARRIIGIPDEQPTSTTFHEDMDRLIGWDESHPNFGFADRRKYFRSEPGGFACALTLYYGADGPLGEPENYAPEDEHTCDHECNGWSAMSIHMSTGGAAADMLYYLAREIGVELTMMGMTWRWIDPQTGNIGADVDIAQDTIDNGREYHEAHLLDIGA